MPVPILFNPPAPPITPETVMPPVLVLRATVLPPFVMPAAVKVPVFEVSKVNVLLPLLLIDELSVREPVPAISRVLLPLPFAIIPSVLVSAPLAVSRKVPPVVTLPRLIAVALLPMELLLPPFANDDTTKTPLNTDVPPV